MAERVVTCSSGVVVIGIGFRGKTINGIRGRPRARTAFIRDNEFRLGVNNRATILRNNSNCCIAPSTLRNYEGLRTKILVSMFAPRHTSFLGGGWLSTRVSKLALGSKGGSL